MKYKVVQSDTLGELNTKVNQLIKEGWKPIGSHQVVIIRQQNRYRGTQHFDTLNDVEYSQTLINENSD
jgi:hypothetical protein